MREVSIDLRAYKIAFAKKDKETEHSINNDLGHNSFVFDIRSAGEVDLSGVTTDGIVIPLASARHIKYHKRIDGVAGFTLRGCKDIAYRITSADVRHGELVDPVPLIVQVSENPVTNTTLALEEQMNWILQRLQDKGYIPKEDSILDLADELEQDFDDEEGEGSEFGPGFEEAEPEDNPLGHPNDNREELQPKTEPPAEKTEDKAEPA